MDAASGAVVPGAKVEAFGQSVKSGTDGRFTLRELPAGVAGKLKATTADGRSAENWLQPLGDRQLEVVLHVRKEG
jgi:hypothetical protein